MRRMAFAVLLLATAACGSWKRVGTETEPRSSAQTLSDLFDIQAFYKRIGRLSAGGTLPWVGSVAYAGGPHDSTLAVVGLSLQNNVLGFQREGDGFVARYQVDLSFTRTGAPPVAISRQELVRVASFKETQRADESVLFQQSFHLPPGHYTISGTIRDPATGNSGKADQETDVPAFGPGSITAPMLVYSIRGRGSLDDTLAVVLNPRGSVLFGGDTLLAYVEGYDFPGPTRLPIEMKDDNGKVIYSDSISFHGGRPLEGQVLKLRADSTALGALTLTIGQGTSQRSTTALVAFSSAWVVGNYEDMADLLRYFGRRATIDSIKKAPAEERPALWVKFWRETDPDPNTPENEAINAYFSRIAIANVRFKTEGIDGWRTDRGEVYVALGEPDETYETQPGTTNGRVLRWDYVNARLTLFFVDENGFGRYRLDPGSRADFEQVLSRLRRMGH
jgi:GWxTD domain-containing protein